MASKRYNGVIPGGGTVAIDGHAVRLGFKFQNQAANNQMTLSDATGFTYMVNAGAPPIVETGNPELVMQGPLTLAGTVGDAYDLVEFFR